MTLDGITFTLRCCSLRDKASFSQAEYPSMNSVKAHKRRMLNLMLGYRQRKSRGICGNEVRERQKGSHHIKQLKQLLVGAHVTLLCRSHCQLNPSKIHKHKRLDVFVDLHWITLMLHKTMTTPFTADGLVSHWLKWTSLFLLYIFVPGMRSQNELLKQQSCYEVCSNTATVAELVHLWS